MTSRFLNMLRNGKEWIELHDFPIVTRAASQKFSGLYSMSEASVPGLWEADPDALYVALLVVPGAVVLDIGARLGSFCHTVRRTGHAVRLIAFEPIPLLARRLRSVFNDVTVSEVALSDRSGVATFRIPYIDGRRCHSRGSLAPIVDTPTTSAISVRTATLDDMVMEMRLARLDLVKIDVEGHEAAVLRGGLNTFRQLRPTLLVEIEQRHHPGTPIQDTWRFVEDMGYQGYLLNRRTLAFDPMNVFDVGRDQRPEDIGTHRYINNFLFLSDAIDRSATLQVLHEHLAAVPALQPSTDHRR